MKSTPYTTRDAASGTVRSGHIPAQESDGLAERIADAIGDEPVVSFGKRCGIGESTLRNYLSGSDPSRARLVAIADAAGVTVEWLATGRGPKLRRDLVAALRAASEGGSAREERLQVDLEQLRTAVTAVEEGLHAAGLVMPPDKKAEVFVYAYELIGQMGATDQARALLARLLKLAR